MFTALIGMMMAGSRLLYSFGRDGMLPSWLGQLDKKNLPNHALITLSIVAIIIGSVFPFGFLAQLISAGALVAFMFVTVGIFALRKREGKDLPQPAFKLPFYPVMPIIIFICVFAVFWGLSNQAKIYTFIWFCIGILYYVFYLLKNAKNKA